MGKITLQKATDSGFCGSLATWLESQVTLEIQPVNDFSNSSMYFSHGLFRGSIVASQSGVKS